MQGICVDFIRKYNCHITLHCCSKRFTTPKENICDSIFCGSKSRSEKQKENDTIDKTRNLNRVSWTDYEPVSNCLRLVPGPTSGQLDLSLQPQSEPTLQNIIMKKFIKYQILFR